MRKRRVGVTARLRRIVGSRKSGFSQIVSEMAAPLELRTPTGTCGKGRNQSADGSMATKAQQSIGRIQSKQRGVDDGARSAHEALPHTSPGGKPPETPAP